MKVLIACEYSGIVREAFKARGHDAWSCDLLDTEIPGNHIKADVLEIINDGWDLMIAHPPCTYVSNMGATWLFRGGELDKSRYEKGLKAKYLFLKLLYSNIPKICIENPIPSKIFEFPNYNQIIQPYYFGDYAQKKTCLWLRKLSRLNGNPDFALNKPTPAINSKWFNIGGKDRQKNRSRFWPGIAKAMAEQWG